MGKGNKKVSNKNGVGTNVETPKVSNKPKKERAKPIEWGDNPGWIRKAIQYLINNVEFRLKLFSDSTVDAKAEDRKKSQGKEGKINMFSTLAAHIFTSNDEPIAQQEWRDEYAKDPHRFATSLQQQFAKLKKTYSKHVRRLKDTGGGLLPEDQAQNIIEQIQEEFEFWDDLHAMWSELPNYNPIGVSNATSGSNHSNNTSELFGQSVAPTRSQLAMTRLPDQDEESNNDDDAADSGLDVPTWDTTTNHMRFSSSAGSELADDMDQLDQLDDHHRTPPPKSALTKEKKRERKKERDGKEGKKRQFDAADLDEIHLKELDDAAQRRDSRTALRMKELENTTARIAAKREKMRLDEKKLELEKQSVALQAQTTQQTFMMMNNLLMAFAPQNTIRGHLNAMGGSNIAGPSMPTFNSFTGMNTTGQEFAPTSTSSPLPEIPALQPGDSSQQGNGFNASLSGNNTDYPDFNFDQI
ncbi:uncharacterized protein C8R40DRAFT_1239977 [Lentinula edodes]|nr:uncharacterized protein C8R40DRAFT_1239977 [Lentinula edodes]KAH7871191.1 hypothetical protein C8R40DRAFT_1239977 [Lentinula edodes]